MNCGRVEEANFLTSNFLHFEIIMADQTEHASFSHPASIKLLLATFAALILLTILTVVTAGQLPRPFGLWVAMGIACIKAALVMLFFMHMFWDKPFNIVAFMSSLLFATLFIGMTLMDTDNYQDSINQFPREPEQAVSTVP